MMTQQIKTFYCSDTKNELRGFHNKIDWVKFVWMQDFRVLLRLDSISRLKTMENNFYAMACREYTLPRKDGSSQPRGWIWRNKKIGPVLKVTSSSLHGQHGVVIRILSLSENNTHSWVRISHGSNNFVMDPKRNDTEVPEDQPEEQAIQLNGKNCACRSKEKAKPQRKELVDKSPSIIPMNARNWIDIEPENRSLSAYEVSKKVIHLLRQQEQWEENGAVPFLENKTTYSESICTNSLLVRQSMGSMLGSRRRSKMEISVLHWCFRNNSFFPSSSRTYRTKSYWSFIAGQCNSAWNIPSHRR